MPQITFSTSNILLTVKIEKIKWFPGNIKSAFLNVQKQSRQTSAVLAVEEWNNVTAERCKCGGRSIMFKHNIKTKNRDYGFFSSKTTYALAPACTHCTCNKLK